MFCVICSASFVLRHSFCVIRSASFILRHSFCVIDLLDVFHVLWYVEKLNTKTKNKFCNFATEYFFSNWFVLVLNNNKNIFFHTQVWIYPKTKVYRFWKSFVPCTIKKGGAAGETIKSRRGRREGVREIEEKGNVSYLYFLTVCASKRVLAAIILLLLRMQVLENKHAVTHYASATLLNLRYAPYTL